MSENNPSAMQGPKRETFAESPSKTAKFLLVYADLIENGKALDSDIVPLMRAASEHINRLTSK